MKENPFTDVGWRNNLPNKVNIDRANQVLTSYTDVARTPEFKSFSALLSERGENIFKNDDFTIKLLSSSDFESINQRIGLSLFANICFDKSMGLDGTSIADNPKGQIKFLETSGKIVSFVGEKIIEDDFGRMIYYLDIAGTLKTEAGKGLGPTLGRISLENEVGKTKKDVVFLSRTQNPMLVGMVNKILPPGSTLSPFWSDPCSEVIESSNWMVNNGFMTRNNARPDSHFNAAESMISWNSYGAIGDGTTWEDMTKQIKNLDWNRGAGLLMQRYLVSYGTNWDEAKTKGHSFVIGCFIKNK